MCNFCAINPTKASATSQQYRCSERVELYTFYRVNQPTDVSLVAVYAYWAVRKTHTHNTLNMLNLFWLRVTLWPAEGKHVIERVRRCHRNRRAILSVCQNLKAVDPSFAFLWNLWDLKVTWLSSKRLQEHQQYDLNLHKGSKAPRGRGLRYWLANNSVLV